MKQVSDILFTPTCFMLQELEISGGLMGPLGLYADLTFYPFWHRADVWSEDCCVWRQNTQGWECCHCHESQMSPGLVVLLECCGSIWRAKTWEDNNETWTKTHSRPRWEMWQIIRLLKKYLVFWLCSRYNKKHKY